MRTNLFKIVGITAVIIMLAVMSSFAQDESPVKIRFDNTSDRLDLMTGEQLPNYTQAQRGSVEFYLGRLDTPYEGFWYFFDGRRFRDIEGLVFIRKMKLVGCWIISASGRNGQPPTGHPKQNCEIIHHAISFIPLNDNGQPQQKAYVLLEDMDIIQWKDSDNWLATDTQEQLESKQGVVY